MNAEQLLAHYGHIADAPDAMPRLRRFILDLAVRGKLVEQDPNDEPASELLKRIAAERKECINRGEIRRSKPLGSIDDVPFELPSGWIWMPLGETGNICTGNSINAQTREQLAKVQEGRPFIATKDVGYGLDRINYVNGLLVEFSDERFKTAKADTVLICAEGGSAGRKTGLTDREICFGNKLLANETWSIVLPRLVLYIYLSNFFYAQFSEKMSGVIGGISLRNFLQLPFPLPPLAEQHRIVAKVDELMGLCDRLEAARTQRETTRSRLTAASFARLNAPDADSATFQNHVAFALDTLPELTSRPDQIKNLRQTILNLAVRGKLVEQDPSDEPASELLKRIAAEKARLVKAGEIKKPKPLEPVDEPPFALPSMWRWTRIREVTSHRGQKTPTSTFTYIDVTAIDKKRGSVSDPKVLGASEAPSRARKVTQKGDVIYSCVRPYLLNVAVIEQDFNPLPIASTAFAILNGHGLLLPRYIWITLRSSFMIACVEDTQRGVAYPAINDADFSVLPFPLPPLAEQHRIVAKVDELMALCDRLEAALADADTIRQRLLEALLHEALTPDEKRAEAA